LFQTEGESSLIKIIDFGIAKSLPPPSNFFHKKVGTTIYMAPEVIREHYNEKCDVWSCGILLHLMLTKSFPFDAISKEAIEQQILDSNNSNFLQKMLENKMISDGAKNFLKKMLEYEPDKRISIEKSFHDEWIQQFYLIKTFDEKIIRTLKNLLQIKFERKLQEFLWMFFVNHFSSSIYDNEDDVLHAFQRVDLNGDGLLSKEELTLAYGEILGDFRKAKKYVEKIMKYLDSNKNGSIDFSEFMIGALSQENFLTRKKLQIGFKMFDKVRNYSFRIKRNKYFFCF